MLLKREKSDGTWTAYAGDGYEVTNTGQVTKYYSIEGQTVAMQQAGTVYYILRDHLGSATQFVTAGGQVHSGQKYYPFGATRSTSGTPPTDKLYTGQQKEDGDSLGLYHYGARVYSTVLAHFLSADPAVASAYDPQSWHAYSYVRNNPLRFVDPTGMYIDRPGDAAPARCDSACQARHDAKQRARDHELLVGALKYLAEKAHQELVGALQYLAYQNEIRSWTESPSIVAGGAAGCDTACQWKAAARAFGTAARSPTALPEFHGSAGPREPDWGYAGAAIGLDYCLGAWGIGGCGSTGIAADSRTGRFYEYASASGPATVAHPFVGAALAGSHSFGGELTDVFGGTSVSISVCAGVAVLGCVGGGINRSGFYVTGSVGIGVAVTRIGMVALVPLPVSVSCCSSITKLW